MLPLPRNLQYNGSVTVIPNEVRHYRHIELHGPCFQEVDTLSTDFLSLVEQRSNRIVSVILAVAASANR